METYPGFTLENRDGIYIYRVHEISRAAVDAWYATDIAQMEAAMASTRHVPRLLHLTRLIFPTPYFNARLHETNELTPAALYESTAILVSSAVMYNTMRPFINRDLSKRNLSRNTRQLFSNEDRAMTWLIERRQTVDELIAAE